MISLKNPDLEKTYDKTRVFQKNRVLLVFFQDFGFFANPVCQLGCKEEGVRQATAWSAIASNEIDQRRRLYCSRTKTVLT